MGMNPDDVIPKYVRIRDIIESDVRRGVFTPGGRLPTMRELAKRFQTTPVTLSKSIELLERDGWLRCKHGRGIFASEKLPKSAKLNVAILLNTQGHLFATLFMSLLNQLQEHDHGVLPIDLPHGAHVPGNLKHDRLQRAFQANPDGLLIDGDAHFPFGALHSGMAEKATFIFRYETELDIPGANRITPDFHSIGALAAEHLILQGSERLIFLGFLDPLGLDGLGYPYSYQRQIWEGFSRKVNEYKAPCQTILQEHSQLCSKLFSALRAGTGFFCVGDYRAVGIYQLCAQMNLRIGEDVPILGLFNTPWCHNLTPALSSISVNEAELARQALLLLEARAHGTIIKIPSDIIVRESTCPAEKPLSQRHS